MPFSLSQSLDGTSIQNNDYVEKASVTGPARRATFLGCYIVIIVTARITTVVTVETPL